MSDYLGDFVEDDTVHIVFTTHDGSGGAVAPSDAFEAADVAIYKDNSATQKTTTNGLTMTSPFDTVTGLHFLTIDTSNDTGDAGFWATGSDYTVVLNPDTETVDSQTVVKVLAQFSIQNRYMRGTDSAYTGTPPTAAAIADAVWDEALSGHQTAGTAGRNLTFAGAILSETTLTGTPTTTVFRLTAGSTTDDFYNDMEIYFIDGNNAGLSRIIADYDGTNRDVTVDEALPLTPASGNAVVIKTNHKHSRTQIGVSVRTEMDANSTGLAAIEADTQDIQSRIPAALTAGGNMSSDVLAISGDTTAADNCESFFDNTGFNASNSTIGTATAVSNTVNASVTSINGDTVAASNFESDYDGTGYSKANSTIGTCTTNTDMRGTDGAYTGTPPTTAAIADAVWDEATSGHSTAGTTGKALTDILEDTGTTLPTQITNLNDLSAADVNAEVVDVIRTDALGEPTQGNPGATISLADKVNYLYKAWRNKSTTTATQYSLYNDAGSTIDHKATLSDDGTTATVDEVVTGP